MATPRRPFSTEEKPSLSRDPTIKDGKSNISPAVPSAVIAKLLLFTLAMVTLPISSYFVTRDALFRGNATYAGGFAAFMANLVLVAYVVVAFRDDKSEREEDEQERKKMR